MINQIISDSIKEKINTFTKEQIYTNNIFFIDIEDTLLTSLYMSSEYVSITDNTSKKILLNYRLKDLSFDNPNILNVITPTYIKKSIGITQNPIEPFTITVTFSELPDFQIYKQFLKLITSDFTNVFSFDILRYDFKNSQTEIMYQFGNCHVVDLKLNLPQSYKNLSEITTSISIVSNIIL